MNSIRPAIETKPLPLPVLSHGRRNQKYGRYDFERFDHLSSSPANIGYGTFHKVNVNCRFLFKKSRWGVLGENRNPAGIIYLDLTFDQPKDCQLYSATVIVTLDDKDDELQVVRGSQRGSNCPVHLTECYGPKGFAGPEKTFQSKKSMHFTPNAQFAGFGFGGLGVNRESSLKYSSRWQFSGNLQGADSTGWAYKTLKWDLSENELETQSTHSNEVHTAFTFAHGGQPFFMRVEIKGKLKKLHTRFRDKLMKFPSSAKKDDGSIVTLISFGNRGRFQMPLDQRAQDLAFEMEMANLNAIPMEVSDPKPVAFLDLPQSHSQRRPSQGAQGHEAIGEIVDPMLGNLAQAFLDVHTLDRQIHHYEDNEPSLPTPFGSDESEIERTYPQILSGEKEQREISEEQIALWLLRMPGLLIFLRVMAGLLGFFSQTASSTAGSEEADQMQPVYIVKKTKTEKQALPNGNPRLLKSEDRVFNNLNGGIPLKKSNRQRERQADLASA